ncbi:MAG TPA: hypothetical protein VFY83_17175, partial [Anaerolineales bacterium]|nr:hypothetical protein [Anaerolineales bacterium]
MSDEAEPKQDHAEAILELLDKLGAGPEEQIEALIIATASLLATCDYMDVETAAEAIKAIALSAEIEDGISQ